MRPRALVATVSILACIAVACSEKAKPALEAVATGGSLDRIKAARVDLEQAWDALDTLRDELLALDDTQRPTAAQAARRTELAAQVKVAEERFEAAYGADQSALAEFLNEALNTQPKSTATLEALRLYADSAIRNARDFIDHSGDYRRAIELLETAQSYHDAVQAVVPDDLSAALAHARDYRFLTRARFDQLRKGMNARDVRTLVGVPFYANVRHSDVGGKRVASWLYGRDDGEVAALYFDDRGTLYAWKWDAKRGE
jgi:hypothetical protein